MDQFGNSLNDFTNKTNQTYATDTSNAANAQGQANAANANVNSEAGLANQNAAKLSALGDQYSNMGNVTNMYNQDQQSQLNNMGFDKNTLNQANQNIAQETGQLGAAQNQMDATGGSRGFNAVGAENRQQNVQNQAANAIGANTKVQSNELGQANAASTYTGQEIGAQQTSQQNAINAYNDAASQNNNVMANYANQLSTLAQQATTYGGLVGSNVANIMAGANSAAQAHLAKYTAQLQVAQANQANAQAGLFGAETTGQNIQNTYNTQLDSWKQKTQKLVTQNNQKSAQVAAQLEANLNFDKSVQSAQVKATSGGWEGFVTGLMGNPQNAGINNTVYQDQTQLQQVKNNMLPNVM